MKTTSTMELIAEDGSHPLVSYLTTDCISNIRIKIRSSSETRQTALYVITALRSMFQNVISSITLAN